MGIHGVFKEIGSGQRVSLAKLAHDHYVASERPFRIAIDIAIWLFQIQAGKGGSNPALRTFYYRLLRLLTLNIQPLFVFDGPNKPLFKRNKRVGGPGVRVASVPEFLAKQLLKQFGFPWHVAPGEAEAECALLQREKIVDAVLSEDVDTLMFGSGVTLRNWSAENSTKTPTHVNLYRAEETKEKSGLDRKGMILVALMSGGDYIVEGIPGCGPKVACDAARAGFGRELCELAARKDTGGLKAWRERLQFEIKTNQSKFFSRKNSTIVIPDDFPDREILGYYTHPAQSSLEKLARLRADLQWDMELDFAALRAFTADAFDWRCLGGAKKFIRNLAPAMLVRHLRLQGDMGEMLDQEAQRQREESSVKAIHGKRNHSTTDGELEYRISFIPATFVPIDLSIEEEDDEVVSASGADEPSDAESNIPVFISGTQADDEEPAAPSSPSKKRNFKPYHPDQPEKLWILRNFLKVGCPSIVEVYENPPQDPKEFFRARRQARAVAMKNKTGRTKKHTRHENPCTRPETTILAYAQITKSGQPPGSVQKEAERAPLDVVNVGNNISSVAYSQHIEPCDNEVSKENCNFMFRATKIVANSSNFLNHTSAVEQNLQAAKSSVACNDNTRTLTASTEASPRRRDLQRTPRNRKRHSADPISPATSQRTILSYWTPSPKKTTPLRQEIIDLISSPTQSPSARPLTPTPTNSRTQPRRTSDVSPHDSVDISLCKLPDTVTKRRKRFPLKRHQTAPAYGEDDHLALPVASNARSPRPDVEDTSAYEAMDLANPSPAGSDRSLPSPATFVTAIPAPRFAGDLPTGFVLQTATAADSGSTAVSAYTASISSKITAVSDPFHAPASQPVSVRRSPRQQAIRKRILLRESLVGSWKEVDAETIDLSGDGSGWKASKGRAKLTGWRKSGVEVLDLTGA